MDLNDFFGHVEDTMLSRFRGAGFVHHMGDRGENRESVLREFLSTHLPTRYGVTKGEIITRAGEHSHSADVIIYDKINCPVLYVEKTAVLPIEGVYGIIEVKSHLSKQEFVDASSKIEAFKRLAPREASVIRTREYVTLHTPSRPFGIVLGYQLADNSLDSLLMNWWELNERIHFVSLFTNLVAVLGAGILYWENVNLARGEKNPILETDEFVTLIETAQKRRAKNEPPLENSLVRIVPEELGLKTFGRFFVYLLIMLERMKLSTPDLGRYLDPSMPMMVHRES